MANNQVLDQKLGMQGVAWGSQLACIAWLIDACMLKAWLIDACMLKACLPAGKFCCWLATFCAKPG